MLRGPARQLDLGVLRLVAGRDHAVAALRQPAAVGADEDGAEGLITCGQALLGELDAPLQVRALHRGKSGLASAHGTYVASPARIGTRSQFSGGGNGQEKASSYAQYAL